MSLDLLLAESAVRRTIAAYCHTCDDGRFDEFAACFAVDAVMRVFGKETVGRDAIRAWVTGAMPAEKRGKHVTVNTVLDIDLAAGRARGATDYLFLDATATVTTAGRYLDEFVHVGDEWLFSVREITFLGRGPGA